MYWARWRGPSGQGVVSGTGYPDSWSGTENVKWKVPVPGNGNSSPIVWGDRIFLTTGYDSGRRLSVVAFRRSDGMKLWETFAPEGRTPFGSHYKNGHASATPATDGQRVYVSFGTRGLLALDMNGKQVWHRDLGPMDAYRHCRITIALQGSPHPVSGSVAQLVHRGVRYTDWKDTLDNAARGGRGLGHADRGSRRRS